MYFKFFLISFVFYLTSCSNFDFVYDNDKNFTNPIYQKTTITLSGLDISSFRGYSIRALGDNKEKLYKLSINIVEEKIKRSVKSNQAISKLDYKLIFKYKLLNIEKNCIVFKKNIFSRFTFEPKSAGYNYGSDQSLNNLYKISAKENLQQFISYINDIDITSCIDET